MARHDGYCGRISITTLGHGLTVLLIVLGLGASLWAGDPGRLLDWGEAVTGDLRVAAALVLLMALMLTFALPGTLVLWLIAPFHPPPVAIALLLLGSVAGAFGAYSISAYLGRTRGQKARARDHTGWLETFLRQNSGLLPQTALRALPGFPHSLVNYSAGSLQLPLKNFLLAATLGLAAKWTIYALAVHGAADAIKSGEALTPQTLLPLVALVLLLLLGAWLRRRVQDRHKP